MIGLFISAALASSSPYSVEERQSYLEKMLGAFHATQKTSIDDLYQFVGLARKQKCRSFLGTVTLNCLQTEVRKNCEIKSGNVKEKCALLSDAILVNQLNEDRFHTLESSSEGSFGEGLMTQYGLLVTHMFLISKNRCQETDTRCLAKEIDQYCLTQSTAKGLSYQACSMAILWFIGDA